MGAGVDVAGPQGPAVVSRHERDGRLELSFVVPADLACLSGHFEIAPIVPGALHVGWALAFARSHWALPPRFAGVEGLKFKGILTPGMQVDCVLERYGEGISFRFLESGRLRSFGRILLA